MGHLKHLATLSVLVCVLHFVPVSSAPASVGCPPGAIRVKLKGLAFALAAKGFDLTQEDMYTVAINFRATDAEDAEQAQKPKDQRREEADACNLLFKNTYIEGLIELGKSKAEVDDWIKIAYSSRGELSPPPKKVAVPEPVEASASPSPSSTAEPESTLTPESRLVTATVGCPSSPPIVKAMEYALVLAAKGFDLTYEEVDVLGVPFRPSAEEKKATVLTKGESDACNAEFKRNYIEGLIKLGKSQAEVDEWIQNVYSSGELRPPKKVSKT